MDDVPFNYWRKWLKSNDHEKEDCGNRKQLEEEWKGLEKRLEPYVFYKK